MLPLIAPLFFLAAGLLVLAGIGKVWRPRPAAQALYAAGLPGPEPTVRGLGILEIVVGVSGLIRPAPWSALLVAALYLSFGGFVAFLLLARPQASSCGCSGAREAPPSWLHVSMNLAAALVAAVAAVAGTPSLGETADSLGGLMVPALLGLATAGWLVVVVASEVPEALRSWTRPSHHEQALFDPDRHRRADVALTTSGVDAGHASLWPDHDPATGRPLGDADVGH